MRATKIRRNDCYPYIWRRWCEVLVEAGFSPNYFQAKVPDEAVLEQHIAFARTVGRLPVAGELRRKAKQDESFLTGYSSGWRKREVRRSRPRTLSKAGLMCPGGWLP